MLAISPEAGIPDFICKNPSLIDAAIGRDLQLSLTEVIDLSVDYLAENVARYDASIQNPLVALSRNAGNCFTRTAIVHGICSVFPHLQSDIIFTSGHAYNVVVERQGLWAAVVNNSLDWDTDNSVDIGTLSVEKQRVAVKPEYVSHDMTGSLAYYAHERRDASSGLIKLWRSTPASEKPHDSPIPTITEERPSDEITAHMSEVRGYTILLGRSATHFVNHLTGHSALNTGIYAPDVIRAMIALGPLLKASTHKITTVSQQPTIR